MPDRHSSAKPRPFFLRGRGVTSPTELPKLVFSYNPLASASRVAGMSDMCPALCLQHLHHALLSLMELWSFSVKQDSSMCFEVSGFVLFFRGTELHVCQCL